MMSIKFKSILITGASSGIGKALALNLSKPDVHLYIGGRNLNKLEIVATECMKRGALVSLQIIDVRDSQEMEAWIKSIDRLDLVLACAGVSLGTINHNQPHQLLETSEQVRQIFDINLKGVLNTVLPAIEVMHKQEKQHGVKGQIAAIASVAGFVNSSWAASYCASKSAVDRFMVSTGGAIERHGIYLSSICCGFVKTPMTACNNFFMPGMVSPQKAAQLIMNGIYLRKRRVIFPLWLFVIARIIDMLPLRIFEKFYLRYLEKNEHKANQ